jgi:hypothetical protein
MLLVLLFEISRELERVVGTALFDSQNVLFLGSEGGLSDKSSTDVIFVGFDPEVPGAVDTDEPSSNNNDEVTSSEFERSCESTIGVS